MNFYVHSLSGNMQKSLRMQIFFFNLKNQHVAYASCEHELKNVFLTNSSVYDYEHFSVVFFPPRCDR